MKCQERNKQNGFSYLREGGFSKEKNFTITRFSPKNKKFHLSIPPRLYIRLHLNYLSLNLPERFFKFPLHVLQFYNLLERFFKFPLHVQHFYLRGFSSFLSMFYISTTYLRGFSHFLSTFYILKSTRGFCKFSSPQLYILQPTK